MSKAILMGVAAAFCMAAASPVLAATPDSGGAPKPETVQSGTAPLSTAKTKYCVIDTLTGSHISKKTCHTRKEWLDQGFDPLAK
ncbi:MAG: hypothetical protein ABI240_17695 [Sphingomonas sp.]